MLTQKQLEALMRAYHAAKVAADKAKDLGDQIKAEAQERGTTTLEAGGFRATLKEVTSSNLDVKTLKTEHPELVEVYMKSTTTTRLYFK